VGKAKITTIWISRLLAKLSFWLPARIIVCSERAIEVHEKLGFSRSKMRFVPNGFDLASFSSNQKDGNTIRAELDLRSDVLLIGTVARYDPQKDHSNLLGALSILREKENRIRCLLVGTNLDEDNLILVEQIRGFGLEDVVILAGRRTDVPAVMSALDLHILPSAYGEAFPNVVAEAMSCETPCVATDVGDSAYIIGHTGWVVPPCDAGALATAIEKALKERLQSDQTRWRQRCFSAKKRIEQLFDIKKMITGYKKVWRESM
jgi:glycosyltransferase involved in cell wall biosynthesis